MSRHHSENHLVQRIGWLRAAVLGANDGIVSTASLIVGVASAGQSGSAIMMTGVAGLVAGSLSMAAGEYVSVSSQADAEKAERTKEAWELTHEPEHEREELTRIYQGRGLERGLAEQVADAMTKHDALTAHLRDELGLSQHMAARPLQAALSSAAAFAVGASLPLLVALLWHAGQLPIVVSLATLLFLALLGAVGAKVGGAPMLRAVARVTLWGAVAMAVTALIGSLFGTSVA